MKGTISFEGWNHWRGHRLRPGLISNVYRHSETNWTAQEVYAGVGNGPKHEHFVCLAVHDESGNFVGSVQSVSELP